MAGDLIVVTGFGPFRGHEKVNPSWEAVKILPDTLDFNGKVFKLLKKEIPVTYEDVDRTEEDLWAMDPLVGTYWI